MRDPTRHRPVARAKAGRRSSALPNPRLDGQHGLQSSGLLVRGVVVATYVSDEDAFPGDAGFERVVGVYCDVLVYSSMEGMREGLIRRALVSQPNMGMHEGHVWKPRAARKDLGQGEIAVDSNPRDLDGDHVLVGFMDNSFTQPVILRSVPHPRLGQGNDDLAEPGHRMKLALADGEPDFWKHRGSFQGFDPQGNFLMDTTRAHAGDYEDDGTETPLDDVDHGNITYRVARNAKFVIEAQSPDNDEESFRFEWDGDADIWTVKTVESDTPTVEMQMIGPDKKLTIKMDDGNEVTLELDVNGYNLGIDGGQSLNIANKDGDTTLTLGDGAVPVAIADPYLKDQLENIISTYNDHTHMVPDGMAVQGTGNLGAPVPITNSPATAEAPTDKMDDYDSNIASGKVTIPDN